MTGGLSLRLRVTLAAAVAVFVAVAGLGVASRTIVAHELRRTLDDTLRARATDVARLSASAPALLTTPGMLDAPFGGRDLTVEVLDRGQRIVARSSALGGRLLPTGTLVRAAIERGHTGSLTGRLSGEYVRVFVAPLADLGGGPAAGGAVIVGASTRGIDATNERLRHLILVFALLAGAAGAAAAAVLTRRGLAPLRRLAAEATRIAARGDAEARLPTGEAGEVGALTDSLNAMLAALDRAQATERRFLADASHELRTPITALAGNAEYLARHGADPAVVADLQADTRRMARLVDDLLALERGRAGGAGPATEGSVDVAMLARSLGEEPGHERVTVDAPAAAWVRGDAGALQRALGNLVENALVHGPADGRVRVTVGHDAGRVTAMVRDDGDGLPAAAAEDAFDRFWRGEDAVAAARPGAGLGLAIVRAAARAHGGEVTVDGPEFTIRLPGAPAPRSSESPHEPGLG
jgi:signal transduction histidine kinase